MRPSVLFSLLAFTAVTLSACGHRDYAEDTAPPVITAPSYIHLSSIAPPNPEPEIPPVIENARQEIWRPGYWSEDDGHFSWVSGTLMPKPNFTAVWSPDHWEKRQYGWAFVSGYWQ